MKARATLRPGQRGTLKLTEEYGDQLLYVRYRYDERRKKRVTTVELIVDEADWSPPGMPTPDQTVGVRVSVNEFDLRSRIKRVGGKWNWRKKVWEVRYKYVLELGIEERIVTEEAESPQSSGMA